MAKYIDLEKALAFPFANGNYDSKHAISIFVLGCQSYREYLESIPAADVAPVVRGEWEKTHRHTNSYRKYTGFDEMGEEHTIIVHEELEYDWLKCPYCGASAADNFQNFCPNCGADMGKDLQWLNIKNRLYLSITRYPWTGTPPFVLR